MTVTLNLSDDTERRLREKAADRGQTLETYLEQLAEQAVLGDNGRAVERSSEDWIAQWRAWTASHSIGTPIADDSRESIYADRGS